MYPLFWRLKTITTLANILLYWPQAWKNLESRLVQGQEALKFLLPRTVAWLSYWFLLFFKNLGRRQIICLSPSPFYIKHHALFWPSYRIYGFSQCVFRCYLNCTEVFNKQCYWQHVMAFSILQFYKFRYWYCPLLHLFTLGLTFKGKDIFLGYCLVSNMPMSVKWKTPYDQIFHKQPPKIPSVGGCSYWPMVISIINRPHIYLFKGIQ